MPFVCMCKACACVCVVLLVGTIRGPFVRLWLSVQIYICTYNAVAWALSLLSAMASIKHCWIIEFIIECLKGVKMTGVKTMEGNNSGDFLKAENMVFEATTTCR